MIFILFFKIFIKDFRKMNLFKEGFEFSKTNARYFKRYMDTIRERAENILTKFRKCKDYDERKYLMDKYFDNDNHIFNHEKFDFRIDVSINLPEKDDDDDDEFDRPSYNYTGITLSIIMMRKYGYGEYQWTASGFCNHCYAIDEISVDKYLESLVKVYTLCKYCCNNLVGYEGKCCNNCYCLESHRDEECCICLEKGSGVWTKLPCNHILHSLCYKKSKNYGRPDGKCPLCRVEVLGGEEKDYME